MKNAPVTSAHLSLALMLIQCIEGSADNTEKVMETTQFLADIEATIAHKVWEEGYAHGYDDREKMDHDRADVIKTDNPYPDLDTP